MCTHQADVYRYLQQKRSLPSENGRRVERDTVDGLAGLGRVTHDPFCGYQPDVATDFGVWTKGSPCRCEFIAQIRADERSKGRVEKACRDLVAEAFENGYRKGLGEAQS